jgi:acyl-CoA synthetase (AMP-forming)/AMP-acid ligase II
VAPTDGEEIDPAELQVVVSQRLAKYKVPAHVEFVDALPRKPNGKVTKSELAAAANSS